MKDFRRPSGQGAGRHEKYSKREDREARPGYNKYQAPRDSAPRREVMHQATCSECKNICEVPFRPNGSKPVYCKNCFGNKKGAASNHFEKREMAPRDFAPRTPEFRPEQKQTTASVRDARIDELKIEVASLHAKIDRMMKIMESSSKEIKPAVVAVPKAAPVQALAKAPAVKMPAKKLAVKAKKAAVPAKKPVAKKKK